MDASIYAVVKRPSGWVVEVDGAPVLAMRSRAQVLALIEDAARLLSRTGDASLGGAPARAAERDRRPGV